MKTWTLCYNHSASLSEYIRTFWILFFHLNFFLLFSLIPNSTLRSDSILVSFLRSQKSLSQRRYPLTMSYSRIVEDKKKEIIKKGRRAIDVIPKIRLWKNCWQEWLFGTRDNNSSYHNAEDLKERWNFWRKADCLVLLSAFTGKETMLFDYSFIHTLPFFFHIQFLRFQRIKYKRLSYTTFD